MPSGAEPISPPAGRRYARAAQINFSMAYDVSGRFALYTAPVALHQAKEPSRYMPVIIQHVSNTTCTAREALRLRLSVRSPTSGFRRKTRPSLQRVSCHRRRYRRRQRETRCGRLICRRTNVATRDRRSDKTAKALPRTRRASASRSRKSCEIWEEVARPRISSALVKDTRSFLVSSETEDPQCNLFDNPENVSAVQVGLKLTDSSTR